MHPPARLATLPLLLTASCASSAAPERSPPAVPPPVRGADVVFERVELSSEFFCEGATFADLDRDGDQDVVAGPWWYAGPDWKERHALYAPKPFDPAGYSDHFFAWPSDVDGDAWTDLVVVGFPGKEACWYRNPLAAQGVPAALDREAEADAHWERFLVAPEVDNESPAFTDLTGDGVPELVFHTGGRFGWAAPVEGDPRAPWVFHALSGKLDIGRFTHGLGVGDVNGDGRADVLWKAGWFAQPASLAGDPEWRFHPFRFSDREGGAQMFAYDVDGDGDNDVITALAAHHFGLSWFEHMRTGSLIDFVEHRFMDETPEQSPHGVCFAELHALDLADVNRDGLLDIVTGKRWWAHGAAGDPQPGSKPEVWWFELARGKKGVDWVPHLADDASGVGTELVTGDVDGDGRRDVVIGNKRGAFVLMQRTRAWQRARDKARRASAKSDPKTAAVGSAGPGAAADAGVKPAGHENLDFETGDLSGWTAHGEAFEGQPIRGDTATARHREASRHAGEFWIGGYELHGDGPKGRLISKAFRVEHPFVSFLVGGGGSMATRVDIVLARRASVERKQIAPPHTAQPEIVLEGEESVLFQTPGANYESMQRVVVDLHDVVGQDVFVRLVDEASGGWGHVNFDDFRFHPTRPSFERAGDVPALLPMDAVPNSGLGPLYAAVAMTVPEGFHVELVASEPDLQQPIAFTFDAQGRIWIAEAFTYPKRAPEGEGRDTLLVLEDADHDGSFEKRTVFAEHLNLVSGLEVGFGGVWVGAAPYLLFIPDRDDDLMPDGPPEILLDGWGYEDTHETLNAFTWGPDGWLYGCHGVFTHSKVGKPGTPAAERVPINAGVWRFHPTRREVEVFAWGTSNPWGVDFDDRGQAFATACVIPHLFHVIQGARYERQAGAHFGAHVYDDIKTIADHRHYLGADPHGGNLRSNEAGGGHAHCGAMIYLGDRFPAEYRNTLFMSNIHGNRINRDVLERAGSGFVGRHGADFLLANDKWFRGINLKTGPDGSVYLIDWYDQQACHDTTPERWDRTNGRLYRVTYGKHVPAGIDMRAARSVELVNMIANVQKREEVQPPDEWIARKAQLVLAERGPDPETAAALRHLLTSPVVDARARLGALWTLHASGNATEDDLGTALQSDEEDLQAWAIQLACEKRAPSAPIHGRMLELAETSPSPRVRLYLASAVQRIGAELGLPIAERLALHGEDAKDHNLPLMDWYAIEPLVAERPDWAIELARATKIPLLETFIARRLAAEERTRDVLVREIAREGQSARVARLVETLRGAVADLRGTPMPPAWPAVYTGLAQHPDRAVRDSAIEIAAAFGDAQAFPSLRKLLADPKGDTKRRERALDVLVRGKDAESAPILRALLGDAHLRGPALRALPTFDDPDAARAILERYAGFGVEERRDALNALASRPAWARALLDAVGDGRVAQSDLSAFVVRAIEALGDASVSAWLREVYGEVRVTNEAKQKRIAELKQALTAATLAKADRPRGREVFSRLCAQCHVLYGAGGQVGPDITGSNRADLDYLLTHVVDPNAIVPKDYLATMVWLKDERVVSGLLRSQTDSSITIATENATVVLARADVDEVKLTSLSTMPEGLLDTLAADETRDLVAYVQSPAQTPLRATEANRARLFDGSTLAGWTGTAGLWSVENGEIVGRTRGLGRNEFLVSELELGDFRLELDVRLAGDAGNSGIQFRSKALEHGEVSGYQADIGPGWWGKLYEEHGRAVLSERSCEEHVVKDGWNHYAIEATGHRVRTWINGEPCTDLEDDKGALRGVVALQLHSGGATEVRFKDLRLEVLD